MRRDAGEDVIARKQRPVQIERTLRDVRVGDRDPDPFCAEDTTQLTDSHPVIKRRFMKRKILEELTKGHTLPWSHVA